MTLIVQMCGRGFKDGDDVRGFVGGLETMLCIVCCCLRRNRGLSDWVWKVCVCRHGFEWGWTEVLGGDGWADSWGLIQMEVGCIEAFKSAGLEGCWSSTMKETGAAMLWCGDWREKGWLISMYREGEQTIKCVNVERRVICYVGSLYRSQEGWEQVMVDHCCKPF
mgnify:CR=1 FL=1